MLVLLSLLTGCGDTEVRITDDTADAATDTADTASDTASDTGDTGEVDESGRPHPFAGDRTGALTLSTLDPDGAPRAFCEGEGQISVDDAGALEGSASCTPGPPPEAKGPPEPGGEVPFTFTGAVSVDGAITGTYGQGTPDGGEDLGDIAGAFTGLGARFTWTGSLAGPEGVRIDYEGAFETH